MSSNDFMRRRSSGDMENPASDDEDNKDDEKALIYGHLQKLGRNGKWQTRWFETDGECLSYYKSSKRSKLLATLDLEKVRDMETYRAILFEASLCSVHEIICFIF